MICFSIISEFTEKSIHNSTLLFMDWLIETLRSNPALAVFLVIGIGFWIGQLKYKSFSLGTVTSVLLVGVLVGQLDIPISGPLKSVFFLLFLFAIGYSVGPQFFQALKGDGLKQVGFAVVVCLLCLIVPFICAKVMGYNPGEAVGLLAGAQTISAVIGVGSNTINTLSASAAEKQAWISIIPVCYAVCYVFGTIGSAYLLGNLGPKMLGGLAKVREQTAELARKMNQSTLSDDPGFIIANRPVAFRAYKVSADFFSTPKTIEEIESHLMSMGRRLFVERVRSNGNLLDATPELSISKGDEIVLSGRRQYVIEDESWIGEEVNDAELLNFPVMKLGIIISKKYVAGMTIDRLRAQKFMYGVVIDSITRSGVEIPVMAQTKLMAGDYITIVGMEREVENAVKNIGYAERKSTKTDLIFVGLGIFIGGIIGALTVHLGGVPISLSTSGGALIAGLLLGWLRSKRPTFGFIPQQSVWLLNNLGLNTFIAVIGITSGPTFISGLKEEGFMLFFMGVLATSLPLIISIFLGAKLFKFHPAINLGCCAGSRTTTAALGAIQEQLGSTIPAMGYTVTYAIGNTLLILWGVAIVLMMA